MYEQMDITKYDQCVTCGVETYGADMCQPCETDPSVTCPQCGELATPYHMYMDGMCMECMERSELNYEREHASLSAWYYNNN